MLCMIAFCESGLLKRDDDDDDDASTNNNLNVTAFDVNFSQGSVAMFFKHGKDFRLLFIANFE